jgi:hypothetical protein
MTLAIRHSMPLDLVDHWEEITLIISVGQHIFISRYSASEIQPNVACPRFLATVSLDAWGTHGLGFSVDIESSH